MRIFHIPLILALYVLIRPYAAKSVPISSLTTTPQRLNLGLEAILNVGPQLYNLYEQRAENENFVVSPLSATLMIGQLMLGGDNNLQKQLYDFLQLPNKEFHENEKLIQYCKDKKNLTYPLPFSTFHLGLHSLMKTLEMDGSQFFKLIQKSATFLNKNIELKTQFERNLRNFYSVDLKKMDFEKKSISSLQAMNNWALMNTRGLIPKMFDSPPSPSTAAILANVVYFYGEWDQPFSNELNRQGLFSVNENKQVTVTYMIHFLENVWFSENDDFIMTNVPYKNEELGMYFILPKKDNRFKYDLKKFAKSLTRDVIATAMDNKRRHNVAVKIPKMSLRNSVDILDYLKKYLNSQKETITPSNNRITFGRMNLFDSAEDKNGLKMDNFLDISLTNAVENGNLPVNGILQQIVLSVNEKGTEAAAVSATTIDYSGGSKSLLLDRPFISFIRHEKSGTILFWGAINNPSTS